MKQDAPIEQRSNNFPYHESVESYVKHLIDRKRIANELMNKDIQVRHAYSDMVNESGSNSNRVEKRWFNSEYDRKRPGWELAFGKRKRMVL